MEVKNQLKYLSEKFSTPEKLEENIISKIEHGEKITAIFLPSSFKGEHNIEGREDIKTIPTTKNSLLNLLENPTENHNRIRYASDEVGSNKFLQSLIIAESTGNLQSLSNKTKNMILGYAKGEQIEYKGLHIGDIEGYFTYLDSKSNISGLSAIQNITTILNDFENQCHAIQAWKNSKVTEK